MLEYRRDCERCGRELADDDLEVYICSFECTWCASCAATFPHWSCPNCGGNLVLRPIRPRHLRPHAPAAQPHSNSLLLVGHGA
ncbi:MAG: DUF1272 domain-containing protein [Micropruina sp.]|uniref:DUF1272 domain-containing protein n=1 Tax=Micropruina sp. TaxID=2737536 RepID=UPI0039E21B7D